MWVMQDDSKVLYYCKAHIEKHDYTHGVAYEARVYESLEQKLKTEELKVYRDYNFVQFVRVLNGLTLTALHELLTKAFQAGFLSTIASLFNNPLADENKNECPNRNPTISLEQLGLVMMGTVTDTKPSLWNIEQVGEWINTRTYSVVVTQSVGSSPQTMRQFFENPTAENKRVRCCLLSRLLLCIHQLHLLKVCHNDLHWDNVLVQKHPSTTLTYKLGEGETFEYQGVEYSPVLFDWDLSQMDPGKDRMALNGILQGYDEGLFEPPYLPVRDYCKFIAEWRQWDRDLLEELAPEILQEYGRSDDLARFMAGAEPKAVNIARTRFVRAAVTVLRNCATLLTSPKRVPPPSKAGPLRKQQRVSSQLAPVPE
jgi:hypothetical protein